MDVGKCQTLYLAGQFSFQDVFMEACVFDGKFSSKFGFMSMSVMEAVKKLASPQGELTPHELHSVEANLNAGTLKSISLGLMTWDSPSDCNGLPFSKLQIRPSLLQLCRVDPCWRSRNGQDVLDSLYALLQHSTNFLAYDKHGGSPKVFAEELRKSKVKLGWTWLASAINGDFVRFGPGESRHSASVECGPRCQHEQRHGKRMFVGEHCWFDWRPGGASDTPMAVSSDDGNMVLLPYVLHTCLDWLANEDHFDGLTVDEKKDTRAAIEHQLHEVGLPIDCTCNFQ